MQTETTGLWRHAQPDTLELLVNALRAANLAAIHGKHHAEHDRALSAAIEAVQAQLPEEMQRAPSAGQVNGMGDPV